MEINQDELKALVENKGVVVVDVWAPWCGPCKVMGPIWEEFAKDNPEQIIRKINVDENDNVGAEYGVRGIPTFLFFKDGVVAQRLSGSISKDALQVKLEEVING